MLITLEENFRKLSEAKENTVFCFKHPFPPVNSLFKSHQCFQPHNTLQLATSQTYTTPSLTMHLHKPFILESQLFHSSRYMPSSFLTFPSSSWHSFTSACNPLHWASKHLFIQLPLPEIPFSPWNLLGSWEEVFLKNLFFRFYLHNVSSLFVYLFI